jgi:Na+:H+ antiporter, NhaA family
MKGGPTFTPDNFDQIAREFKLPPRNEARATAGQAAKRRVQEDVESAQRSGVLITPTFFINNRRYEGSWDTSTLADAMLGTLGHRLHAAAVDFVRWGPSAGLLLLLMSVLAVVLANAPIGPAFDSWWSASFGFELNGRTFTLPLLDWVNHGLLTIFFLVVGLEIKREFTVGHLATLRAAALPVVAALGGITVPILLYLLVVPQGPLSAGCGVPIATDTAFAVALIVLLGDRVPVELRVFLTAAVIIDDLVAIAVIALFYSGAPNVQSLMASAAVTGLLMALNHWGIYRSLPYTVLGVILWICLHEAGLHATLAGVILAIILGLVIGKPVGIVLAAWLAVRFGIAVKPAAYSWRQLCGAGVLAGIGFTMSLFIAGEAFPDPADYAAAKIAIFLASLIAGVVGAVILYPRSDEEWRPRLAEGAPLSGIRDQTAS